MIPENVEYFYTIFSFFRRHDDSNAKYSNIQYLYLSRYRCHWFSVIYAHITGLIISLSVIKVIKPFIILLSAFDHYFLYVKYNTHKYGRFITPPCLSANFSISWYAFNFSSSDFCTNELPV
jgi:hypothetical protein